MALHLDQTQRDAIARKIAERFILDGENSEALVDDIELAFNGNDAPLFYRVKYLFFLNDSITFSNDFFLTAYEIYHMMISQTSDLAFARQMERRFFVFVMQMYNDQFEEMQKIERRCETIKRIKKHVTGRLNEMLDTQKLMIANISHEMRTSLNAVAGYVTQVIDSNVLKGEELAYLEKAERAAKALKSLVTDILDISKINAGEMEIREDYFWLDEVLLHCIDNVIEEANKKELTFKVETDFFPMRLLGDAHRIVGILTNLLSNAVKFTDAGGVSLTVRNVKEYRDAVELHFSVEDTGIGMDDKQVREIFQPFSRFAAVRQGVGLGMLISLKLAQRMGGDMHVSSEKGTGTVVDFTVKLPIETSAAVNMENVLICFFNDTKDSSIASLFSQKMNFLKRCGAKTVLFGNETEFTNYLLNESKKAPDIITIASYREAFAKYDALIHYLKVKPKFHQTTFIAEQTGDRLPLVYFDKSFDRFSTISAYANAVESGENRKRKQKSVPEKGMRILAVDDIETNLEVLRLFITNKYPDTVLDMALGGIRSDRDVQNGRIRSHFSRPENAGPERFQRT